MYEKKSPWYDLNTGKVLQELPQIGIWAITQIYNVIVKTGYFPSLENRKNYHNS